MENKHYGKESFISKSIRQAALYPPSIGVHTVEMEQGIAASSVIPTDPNGEIMEEWETGEDREGDILW